MSAPKTVDTPSILTRPDHYDLAYEAYLPDPQRPVIVFLSGYRSDMNGTKATILADWARDHGHNLVRFDYAGHGQSGGVFGDLTIADWVGDACAIIDAIVPPFAPMILIGSSMGGWVGLNLLKHYGARVKRFIGIAAAPDFTRMMRARLTVDQRALLAETGRLEIPSSFGPDPYVITQKFLDDGDKLSILDDVHYDITTPITLIQGGMDPSVPVETPDIIASVYPSALIAIHIVSDGDHGLSRPDDMWIVYTAVEQALGS